MSVLRAFVLGCALLAGALQGAEEKHRPAELFDVDIPAMNAADALNSLARQTGAITLFPYDVVKSRQAHPVSGRYSLMEAMAKLLEGSGLEGRLTGLEVIQISVKSTPESMARDEAASLTDKPIEGNDTMRDNNQKKSRSLLATAIAAVFSGMAGNAVLAQAPATGNAVEEVMVTGTRIRQTDGMVSPVPVTVMTKTELANYEPGGTIAEQLDGLPQFFNTATAQRGTGGSIVAGTSGGSYLDMRGLGAQRTLVLFDGQRLMPADKRGSPNVDMLPTALIRSVDVVTGGASAAYGADALGGVTNFVLDREFQGFKFEAGTGVTEFGDGGRWNLSAAGGTQLGERLHVIGSLEARHINQIWRDPSDLDEDWFQRWGHVTNPDWYPGAPAGIPQRLTLPWVASTDSSPTGVIWARSKSSPQPTPLIPFAFNGMTFLEDGSAARPFIKGDVYAAPERSGSTMTMSGGPEAKVHNAAFDGGPLGNEVVGRSAFGGLQYRFTDAITGFAQVLAGRSESNFTRQRGSLYLGDGKHATVFRNNAFLPEEIGLAMDEAGIDHFQLSKLGSILGTTDVGSGADNRAVFSTYSWTLGMDVMLANGWDLRASWQSGESDKRTGIYDEVRIDRVFLAMDAVRDPASGAIVCNVQLYNPTEAQLAESIAHLGLESTHGGPLMSPIGLDNSIRDCIPFNVMGAGNMSQAAADYMSTPIIGDSKVKQDFAELVVTGDAYEGWGYGAVSMAAGLTYREQSFNDHALPDDIDALGPPQNAPAIGIRGLPIRYYAGLNTLHQFSSVATASGSYDVWEWFGELNVPFWQSEGGSQRVDGSVAYRSSDYSSVGRIESWKLGVDFQLFDGLRLRMTKSRDVREASFSERFDSQNGGASITDPRKDNGVFTTVVIAGGNPNLRPEIADTVVAGMVFEPDWVPGLRVATDWYEVKIKDAVGTLGEQRIIDECELNGVQSLCQQIVRSPIDGSIATIYNVFLNVAQAKVEGVDFEAVYRMEPDFFANQRETLSLRALAGYLIERSDTPLGGQPFDIAGQLNTPDLTANLTLGYELGPYGIQLQQRYIADTIRNVRWVEGVDVDDNTVASGNTTNLRLSYDGELESGATWRLELFVTNLFDRAPPIIASSSPYAGSQTINYNYDVFGRRYQLGFNLNF